MDYGTGGTASLFGIGSFGFYSTESERRATHNFTIGSSTIAENNIEWYATTGDIDIAHRIAKAGGNQNYTAAGRITVKPGEDTNDTVNRTQSTSCSFNMFTIDLTAGVAGANGNSKSTEYQASSFESQGTNVFRAGKDIAIIIPQISGTGNVFDAVLVSLENKANEQTVHTSSYGVTISTNLAKTAAGTLGANFGTSDSYNSSLNNAYIRGATDFIHSQVKNQGCLVMNIDNAGASYEYIPGNEVHESSSFAIGLSGLDLSSSDAFAYSLGRSLASSAASAGVGMLASQAGLGGFVSTIAASLAGSYVAGDDSRGIKEVSSVAFERSGQGFQAVNIGFDKSEFDTVVNKIKENIFNEALNNGLPTEQAVRKLQEGIEQFTQQVSEEKAKVDVTAERIDNAESVLRDEITSAIGDDEVRKLAEGKSISAENRDKVIKSLSKSIQHLERQNAELNLHAPINQNEVQQASLQTQNELINEKIQQYSLLSEFLSRAQSGITRSNSADNLLHDTYIRQGQRAFGTVAGAFSGLAYEADSMSQHDYVVLQRSRLPMEAQNNPEVLAKLGAGYALYKGAAKLGHCISALDDAAGNVVSETMHKLGECFEWLGTHTRRFVRDDLGFSQRVAQNTGDIAQITAEIFGPGAVVKGIGAVGQAINAVKTTVQARLARNIYARFNQAPYNPRNAQNLASDLLGSGEFSRTTVPGQSMPNVHLAGQCKERIIGTDPITGAPIVQRITFDQRGFPVFDPYVKVETRISGDLSHMLPDAHMRAATRQLRADIEAGKIDSSKFTRVELDHIDAGKAKIGEYTWHHHQETGRMQLVSTDIHEWIKHVGGNNLWGIKND